MSQSGTSWQDSSQCSSRPFAFSHLSAGFPMKMPLLVFEAGHFKPKLKLGAQFWRLVARLLFFLVKLWAQLFPKPSMLEWKSSIWLTDLLLNFSWDPGDQILSCRFRKLLADVYAPTVLFAKVFRKHLTGDVWKKKDLDLLPTIRLLKAVRKLCLVSWDIAVHFQRNYLVTPTRRGFIFGCTFASAKPLLEVQVSLSFDEQGLNWIRAFHRLPHYQRCCVFQHFVLSRIALSFGSEFWCTFSSCWNFVFVLFFHYALHTKELHC